MSPRIILRLSATIGALLALSSPRAEAQQFGNFDFQGTVQCTAATVPNGCLPLVLAAAGAGTFNSVDLQNVYGKGVAVGAYVSAKSGTIDVTVNVQGKDQASGQYYTICSTASITGTGFSKLVVYPGVTVASNVACSHPLPATWRLQAVSGTGTTPSVTMTVGASLIE